MFEKITHKYLIDKHNVVHKYQFVFRKSQGTDSKVESVTCGVPQGSILVPPLFNIYVNDISDISNRIFPILFSDEGNSIHIVIASLNIELYKLNVWLKANKLSVNVVKHISWCFTVQDENNITIT